MIKFIYKKNHHTAKENGKVVIYYNARDIILGAALMLLVAFFIRDYLSHSISYFRDKNTGQGFEAMYWPGITNNQMNP